MTLTTRAARWSEAETGFPFEPYLLTGEDVRRGAYEFASTGAVTIGPPALEPAVHEALVLESRRQREVSAWDLVGHDGTPGELPQDTVRAQLGPTARSLLAGGATRALLEATVGRVLIPGWSATCLTFYEREGMYLSAHRDKPDACQYALLLYLEASWPEGSEPGPGLKLHVRDPHDRGVALRVLARPNRMLLIHGARLTHFRPPLAAAESLAMLNGCFAVAE